MAARRQTLTIARAPYCGGIVLRLRFRGERLHSGIDGGLLPHRRPMRILMASLAVAWLPQVVWGAWLVAVGLADRRRRARATSDVSSTRRPPPVADTPANAA
jgi:hypothetical protein